MHCIQRKGYCTEKEVVYILGNEYRYEVTETQIKRCLNEIMDCYGLKKVKANKVLKEQFDIKSDGYPYIIIEDVIYGVMLSAKRDILSNEPPVKALR